MNLRVAVFEDNHPLREMLFQLINGTPEMSCVGAFPDAANLVRKIEQCTPEVILMDIDMPGISGIEAVSVIKEKFPAIQILMQTVFEDDERVFDSICAGASGYILKNFLNTKLVEYIKELQFGGSPMSPAIARKVLTKMQSIPQHVIPEQSPDYHLTKREKEVLACMVNGLSYKMIADQLFISYETVRSHIKKIYEKLHVASLTEMVAKAIHQRIV